MITPTELAKKTNQRPQAIFNLIRQGYIAAVQAPVFVEVEGEIEAVENKTLTVITDVEATRYIEQRQEKAQKKADKAAAETK